MFRVSCDEFSLTDTIFIIFLVPNSIPNRNQFQPRLLSDTGNDPQPRPLGTLKVLSGIATLFKSKHYRSRHFEN